VLMGSRSKSASRDVRMEKLKQVGRLMVVESFVGKRSYFEGDAVVYR